MKTTKAIHTKTMDIKTEDDFIGYDKNHHWSRQFKVLKYRDGFFSTLPQKFFRNWLDEESNTGTFYIGKGSGLGVGSIVKYDSGIQSLRVGRFVSGGLRLKFLLNGQHEMKTLSTAIFAGFGQGLTNAPPPQYQDSIIKNDVWMGDEMMMLGGGIIENGVVIGARSLLPPNFRSEPYGIYAGSPAKLVRFRFSEKVREALIDIAWWDMPNLFSWVKEMNGCFTFDLTLDEQKTLEILALVKEKKQLWLRDHQQ